MSIELWAGIECTVNRVHDTFFDQVIRSGHDRRSNDLDLFASLGIKTLRYPVVWERTAPDQHLDFAWNWSDERLERLLGIGIDPIVGLLHHGSGPHYTSLLDPEFPNKFKDYARAVAERYPWVSDYTPVNEPLTTARFSGLYGKWFPHRSDEQSFARALLNECRATVLAMREIRKVNPKARLIQTEDFGKTFSTRKLAYQAAFENERRWITFDLLCGRLNPGHAMWRHFVSCGVPEPELQWFCDNTCAPDILGMNHYVTSDRYLDEGMHMYPICAHGSNGQDCYADVEAVRVDLEEDLGLRPRIQEAWDRFHLPIAITEAHLGSAEDEQTRWLWDVWQAAQEQRESGVDLRAVTVWALLGSYDWDSLVVRDAGSYEPGVFDVSYDPPRPTALARLVSQLTRGEQPTEPTVLQSGWWQRQERLLYRRNHIAFP
jgi:dTDP-4-dehydrorhamnose reductase